MPVVMAVMQPSEQSVTMALKPDQMVEIWSANGIREGTIQVYLMWIARFRRAVLARRPHLESLLTRAHALEFANRYAVSRGIDPRVARLSASSALRAWSWALAAHGHSVPPWVPEKKPVRPPTPLVEAFVHHRRLHRGVSPRTLLRDATVSQEFLSFLRTRRVQVGRLALTDVDAFLLHLRPRLSFRTIADNASCLRGFLRFLHATGRLRFDLASSITSPRVRRWERPPRVLPWSDVKKIICKIARTTLTGRRDYALLLAMAVYGLGACEVEGLQLEDIDWTAGQLVVRRRKTGREILLPLLPAVGEAIANYLRHGRPRHSTSRAIFVQHHAPYSALSTATAIRHVLRKWARSAGVSAPFLGSHVLRHSHASRQVDPGVPQRVVGDILGHDHPDSTSVYVRVAMRRLRALSLPVPK